jgi:hypothetical protein
MYEIFYDYLRIRSDKKINKCKRCEEIKDEGMDESERLVEYVYFNNYHEEFDHNVENPYYCNECKNRITFIYNPTDIIRKVK